MPSEPDRLFPPYRLDPANAQLWRNDEEISLRPKTFEVLRCLVEHPGLLVTKAMLLDAVWPEVAVSDTMPATCIAELRRRLGDDARNPRFIETVHRRGYRFIAKVTTAATPEADHKPPFVPKRRPPIIVGREQELTQLRRWYSQILEGERRVVFVAGEAGIGKTTFVEAFLDSIAQEGTVRVGRGQCIEQYGTGEPYMPVFEALTRLYRESGGARVTELLRKFAPTWLAQMPSLLDDSDRERLQNATQGVTQQRMLREMTEALEALASESPLVLLLEDMHWSDFSTLELIAAVARQTESAQLMILGTYRSVEMLAGDHPLRTMKEELELHRYCEELRLKLLKETDIGDYLALRFSGTRSRQFDRFVPAIHSRTDGNPLFMVNVVDYLVDQGIIANTSELSPIETTPIDRLDTPRSIRQMIERNLERLKPEEQAVLVSASAAGAEFSSASVAAALERPQDEVEACCAQLSRHEQFLATQGPITWPDGTIAASFRFHHTVYQEVLYSRLPAGHQIQLHHRIALREEAGYGERADEVATELAYHYSLANIKNKAIQYFQLAGERAAARGAVTEAESHYRHALQLLYELPHAAGRDRQELELQMALGLVLWRLKSWSHPDASQAYRRAKELAEKLGETNQLMAVLLGLGWSAIGGGHFRLGRQLAERMLSVAEASSDRALLCVAHTRLGDALIWRAQYADAEHHLELGRRYYTETDPSVFTAFGIVAPALAALVVLLRGFSERARRLMNEALRRAERHGEPFWAALVHLWAGVVCSLLHDAPAVHEHALALRYHAARQPVWNGFADVCMAKALMIEGEWEQAMGYLRKGIDFYRAAGLASHVMFSKIDELKFLASQRRIDEGLAMAADAIADSAEFPFIACPVLRQRANFLAQEDASPSMIESAYWTAIECARSQDARYFELEATTDFARWLKSQGRVDEARVMLTGIYFWFTEGFDTIVLTEGKALLDELAEE
jgi:DNA-binding winged helix-turn-helix (wHTH) protein/tetratricopeptide (TPR) repeat protein